MNRTQNRPKRRQEKQLSARRKHWYHMQVTDRPSPDAPSLTQAIIVQMVVDGTRTGPLDKKIKKNNIITTKVSCRELGILLLRRHLILVVENFPIRCESEPKFVVKQRWHPTQRPKREVLYFTHKYLNGSLVHKLKCVCSKVVGADVLNGWCKWWTINGVEVQGTCTLC